VVERLQFMGFTLYMRI